MTPDFWISNILRYFSFALEGLVQARFSKIILLYLKVQLRFKGGISFNFPYYYDITEPIMFSFTQFGIECFQILQLSREIVFRLSYVTSLILFLYLKLHYFLSNDFTFWVSHCR